MLFLFYFNLCGTVLHFNILFFRQMWTKDLELQCPVEEITLILEVETHLLWCLILFVEALLMVFWSKHQNWPFMSPTLDKFVSFDGSCRNTNLNEDTIVAVVQWNPTLRSPCYYSQFFLARQNSHTFPDKKKTLIRWTATF